MGENADIIRPIWRTPLAAVLVAWMLIVVGITLSAPRLIETLPGDLLLIAFVGVYLLPIPALLVWGFWAMLREPLTGWLAPTLLLTFCGAAVPAAQPLFDTGVHLNFLAHRSVYDEIALEARKVGGAGMMSGSRDGVRFSYDRSRPSRVFFGWGDGRNVTMGVYYDNTPCVARRGRVCAEIGRPLAPNYSFYWGLP